jgi:hypothetical protein
MLRNIRDFKSDLKEAQFQKQSVILLRSFGGLAYSLCFETASLNNARKIDGCNVVRMRTDSPHT